MAGELQTCLNALPSEMLEAISGRHPGTVPDAEMLASSLTDLQRLRDGWRRLDGSARRMLLDLVWFTPGWIPDREISRFLRRIPTFGEIRRTIGVLQREGWIYAARGPGNERVWLVPTELRRAWMRMWMGGFSPRPLPETKIRPGYVGTPGLGQAFFHFLATIDLQPLPLTAAGRMSLREAQKLDVELDLDSGIFAGTKWEACDGLPPWIAFLADVASAYGLAEPRGEHFATCRERFASWLGQSYPCMVCRLYETVRELFSRDVPESSGFWLMLEALDPDRWYGLEDLARYCRSLFNETGRSAPKWGNAWEKAAALLEAAGWLWTGEWEGKSYVRRTGEPPWTEEGLEEGTLFLESDMEILIPWNFPLSSRYQLEKMADFMGGERMLHYVMTEATVHRAMRCGMNEEAIGAFLSSCAGARLPEWAGERIRHWAGSVRSVFLETAVLVRTANQGEADRITQSLGKAGWKVEKLKDAVLAVSGPSAEVIRKCLHKQGWDVEPVISPLPPPDPADKCLRGQPAFRVEGSFRDQLVPEERGIPKIWTTGLRSYRPDMVREILQKSMESRLDVLAEIQGKPRVISPERCVRRDGEWIVEGRENGRRKEISIGQIRRVQILLGQKTGDLEGHFL